MVEYSKNPRRFVVHLDSTFTFQPHKGELVIDVITDYSNRPFGRSKLFEWYYKKIDTFCIIGLNEAHEEASMKQKEALGTDPMMVSMLTLNLMALNNVFSQEMLKENKQRVQDLYVHQPRYDERSIEYDDYDYDADTFYALTDGQNGSYSEFKENDGDFDVLFDGLGR